MRAEGPKADAGGCEARKGVCPQRRAVAAVWGVALWGVVPLGDVGGVEGWVGRGGGAAVCERCGLWCLCLAGLYSLSRYSWYRLFAPLHSQQSSLHSLCLLCKVAWLAPPSITFPRLPPTLLSFPSIRDVLGGPLTTAAASGSFAALSRRGGDEQWSTRPVESPARFAIQSDAHLQFHARVDDRRYGRGPQMSAL